MANKQQSSLISGEIRELALLHARTSITMSTFLANKREFLQRLDGGPVKVYVIHTDEALDYEVAYPHGPVPIPAPAWLPANVSLFRVPNSIYQHLLNVVPALPAPSKEAQSDRERFGKAQKVLRPKARAWVADAFFSVLRQDGPPLLLTPTSYPDPIKNDLYKMQAANALAMHTSGLLRPTRYKLDGGNLLIGDGFVLAGADIWHENRPSRPSGTLSDELATFTARLGANLETDEVVWIGSNANWPDPKVARGDVLPLVGIGRAQPLFHIDLFVTPLGIHPVPGRTGLFQVILVGEDTWLKIPNLAGKPVALPDDRVVNEVHDGLEYVARQLADMRLGGYPVHVVRAPVFFAPVQVVSATRYGPYSYCNAIVECRSARDKRLYVPEYFEVHSIGRDAIACERKKFVQRMEQLGFKAVFVPGEYSIPKQYGLGALHCQVNVLQRAAVPLPA